MGIRNFFEKQNRQELASHAFVLLLSVLPFLMILAPIAMVLFLLAVLYRFEIVTALSSLKKNRAFLIFIFYYVWIVFGLFYSYESGLRYSRIASQLPLLLLPLAILLGDLNKEYISRAKRYYLWACFVFCLFAFITLVYNLYINHEHRLNYNFVQRSMYHFHYPYDVLYVNIAYIFLLTESKLKRHVELVALVFFVFVFLSGVRMGIFTFFLISVIYIWFNRKAIVNRLFFIKAIVLVVFGIIAINSSQYTKDKLFDTLSTIGLGTDKYVSEVGEDYHKISLRTKLWESSIALFKSRPVLGFGPNGSQVFLEEYYKKKGYSGLEGLNSHNQFLTTALNHGVVGLVILVLLFASAVYGAIKRKDLQSVLCVITLFLAFNTESVLVRQKGVFLFAIVISLVMLNNSQKKRLN